MSSGRAAALSLLLLAAAFAGCGGGGDASTEGAQAGPRVVPLKVSGGGSAQFRVERGDNSIQDYGGEASRAELRRAAEVTHGYFAALATEDWAGACSRLSRKVERGAERLAAASPKLRGVGCAAALGALFGKVSFAEAREATVVDAVGLRRGGARGFLIYRGARDKPYFVSVVREGGGWAVDTLNPSPLG
jgi:hypothetical protein